MRTLKAIVCPTSSGLPAVKVRVQFGLVWDWREMWVGLSWGELGCHRCIWLGFFPCLSLHIYWHWRDPAELDEEKSDLPPREADAWRYYH